MKKDVLTRPFAPEQLKQRPGQHGKVVVYVDVSAVIERLNEAFDHRWDFEVVRHEVHDTEVVVLGKLVADGITKMAFGSSAITVDSRAGVVSVGDDLKAAASDAMKKAASLMGVALEIYSGQPSAAQNAPVTQLARRPNTSLPDRLTSRQLGAIHEGCRRRGISRDQLCVLLHRSTGKFVPEELTRTEASTVISSLSEPSSNGTHA
jgi:hypothetical protein